MAAKAAVRKKREDLTAKIDLTLVAPSLARGDGEDPDGDDGAGDRRAAKG
ncbi:MAG TPA: hypothetical protein VK116_00125 [Planctomycetota bacterium]|nr:hypothetical protein [Planctomycetota bacterium]